MYNNITNNKKIEAIEWFVELRKIICNKFEMIENQVGSNAKFDKSIWHYTPRTNSNWNFNSDIDSSSNNDLLKSDLFYKQSDNNHLLYNHENDNHENDDMNFETNGGQRFLMSNGAVFEKVGVVISKLQGQFSEKFAKEIPGTASNNNFWSSGISLVAHMKSPFIPAVHFNTRIIHTTINWFGGVTDLINTFDDPEDEAIFQNKLKICCDKFNPEYFPKFKKECDKYFYIPHRNEQRGVSGIFFDNFNSGSWEHDFSFIKDFGMTFLDAFSLIVNRHIDQKWTQEDKNKQLIKRGRHVEFNLLYDRGTKFGLMTEGNIDAIFMPMPPDAKWS